MGYWKYDNTQNNSPAIPFYVVGTEFAFSLTFVNDSVDTLRNCYLYVEDFFQGMLRIKTHSEPDSAYRYVMTAMDACAFLGDLIAGEHVIDFIIEHGDDRFLMQTINLQVFLAHDDGVILPNSFFSRLFGDGFWCPCFGKHAFWQSYYYPTTTCTASIPPEDGFSDSLEPQQFEDSLVPELFE
jgi:hypothetical protein